MKEKFVIERIFMIMTIPKENLWYRKNVLNFTDINYIAFF